MVLTIIGPQCPMACTALELQACPEFYVKRDRFSFISLNQFTAYALLFFTFFFAMSDI